jgi:hypothetical protein
MNMFITFFSLTLALFFTIFSATNNQQFGTGFLPENDLYIGVDNKDSNNMTKEQYDRALDLVEEIYSPIFSELGRELIISRKWEDGTVNAYANRIGKKNYIHMFGGLARHRLMTIDGFAMVACHEMGHHIAGRPNTRVLFFKMWASNEGQSDYFAALKCMRKFFEVKDDLWSEEYEINPFAATACESNHKDDLDIQVCKRNVMAGLSLANVLNVIGGKPVEISLESPDPKEVRKTYNKHPKAQCRLDTTFQGALCDIHHTEDIDIDKDGVAQCTRKKGYEVGLRPRCWYKPKRGFFGIL